MTSLSFFNHLLGVFLAFNDLFANGNLEIIFTEFFNLYDIFSLRLHRISRNM